MNSTVSMAIELFTNLYQGAIFTAFINLFFTPKFNKKLNFIICSTVIIIMFATITGINHYFSTYADIEIFAFLAIMVPFSVFCHKGKLWLRIVMPMIIFGLFMCLAMSYTTVISMVFNKDVTSILITSNVYRYIYLLIFNVTYLFILFTIYRFFKNKINLKKPTDIFTCIIIPALTIVITFLSTAIITDESTTEEARIQLGIITIIAFIIVFTMFYIMREITKAAEIRAVNFVMSRDQQMYKKHIENQNRYIEEISHVKHEMRRKLSYVDELIKSGNLTEAHKVCSDSANEIDSITPIYSTPNIYLNAILNVIHSKAAEHNTKHRFTIKSSLDGIDGCDLLSLLGNITDNAFEAMESQKNDRLLQITAFENEHYYIISVKNTTDSNVLLENPHLRSTKADSKHHGHGLKIVRNIVEKYNGNLKFSEQNDIFDVSLMLEKPKEQKAS